MTDASKKKKSAVTTSKGDVCPPPREGGGRPRSALHKAAPPPGTHPPLAAPLLGPCGPGSDPRSRPRRRRSSSLRPACMWRRRRGSTRRAARALAASLLGPRGPGSDSPSLPTNLRVALRARGPAGPAATPPSPGRDHLRPCRLRGGRVLRPPPPPVGAVLARLYRGWRPAGPLCYGRRLPAPSPFVYSCRSAHCGRTPSITAWQAAPAGAACRRSVPERGSASIRPCTPPSPPSISPG